MPLGTGRQVRLVFLAQLLRSTRPHPHLLKKRRLVSESRRVNGLILKAIPAVGVPLEDGYTQKKGAWARTQAPSKAVSNAALFYGRYVTGPNGLNVAEPV